MDTNRAIAAPLREAADRLKERSSRPLALRELYERHGPAALESLPGVHGRDAIAALLRADRA
jgi:hypothetical protein